MRVSAIQFHVLFLVVAFLLENLCLNVTCNVLKITFGSLLFLKSNWCPYTLLFIRRSVQLPVC